MYDAGLTSAIQHGEYNSARISFVVQKWMNFWVSPPPMMTETVVGAEGPQMESGYYRGEGGDGVCGITALLCASLQPIDVRL